MIKKLEQLATKKYWKKKQKQGGISYFLSLFALSFLDFLEDGVMEKGATLTFYTLLSIIPLVAIGFGIAQYLGLDEKFIQEVKSYLSAQPEVADKIVEFAGSALKRTHGGLIAGLGLLVLLWAVFSMISSIAHLFNEIWEVKPRSFFQQLKSFIPIIILFPLFLVGASSLLLFAAGKALFLAEKTNIGHINALIYRLIDFAPFIVIAILLSFLYIYLPNTKVSWKAGMGSGVITALCFQLWQWIYINFQAKSASYGAIYGSFAAIPLFLIWLYYSWLIILFGTELAYNIEQGKK